MMPPAMRKAARLTPSALSRSSPNRPKNSRMPDAIATDRTAIARRWAARAAVGQARENRRAAGRIDHHEEGDEGGDEQLDHSPAGGSQPGAGVRGDQGVAQQDGDRHRPDAARDRRDRAGDLAARSRTRRRRRAASCPPGADAVDADVDHGRAGLQPVALDHLRPADRGDDDVGAARPPPAGRACGCGRWSPCNSRAAAAAPSACRRCWSGRPRPRRGRTDRRAGP